MTTLKKVVAKKTTKSAVAHSNTWIMHDKALKEFERALTHLQKQNYADAQQLFEAVQKEYPQEKELHDRAGIYARICRNLLEPKSSQPRRTEDSFYYGVMKANDAEYDEALKLFDRALQASPKDEKIHYVMASTLALKGDRREALNHLKQAVELNEINRIYARNDPDFEPLRDDETFQNLIHPEEM
jgi:tetratricopeptide (TPR) repeat protein